MNLVAYIGNDWSLSQIDGARAKDDLFDIDAIHFRGPLKATLRHQLGPEETFDNVGLIGLSFVFGILTSVTLNPHLKAMNLENVLDFASQLEQRLLKIGARFRNEQHPRLIKDIVVAGNLKNQVVRVPYSTELGTINMVIREIDMKYVVALEVSDRSIAMEAYRRRRHARHMLFPDERKRIRMSLFTSKNDK